MRPWLKSLLQALYVILGGLVAGGGALTLTQFGGCTPAPIVPPPPPVPPPTPANPVNPVAATAKFYMGGVGCTCTILHQRPAAGKYWLLCAAHCVRGGPGYGQAKLSDGRVLQWRLLRTNAAADLALMVCDGPDGLPTAKIAEAEPAAGTVVWHQGYGVDRPGNKESGTVTRGPDSNGQIAMRLSVSSGDSGSGIFRADTGELVSVVCCYGGQTTYGGGVTAIARLLAPGLDASEQLPQWNPLPMPAPHKEDADGPR